MRGKLGILMLAFVFFVSLAAYSAPQGYRQVTKKPENPPTQAPELYRVIIENYDGGPGMDSASEEAIGCGSLGYFYAEGSTGKFLLQLSGGGVEGPVYNGEAPPLRMDVVTGLSQPVILEGCEFWDGCHGNPTGTNDQFPPEFNNEYDTGYEGILIRFYKNPDGPGPNVDLILRWFLDFVPGPKKHGVGWHIWYPVVNSTVPFPPDGLAVGQVFVTELVGPFTLLHDGIGLGEYDPTQNSVEMPNFNIRLIIERIQ